MKNTVLVIAMVIVFVIMTGCSVESSSNANAIDNLNVNTNANTASRLIPDASLSFEPQIDFSFIHSYGDYDKAKTELWKRYDARKTYAWKEYDQAKTTAWKEYSDFEKEEIARVRGGNRPVYLEYLDAKEQSDYSRLEELQRQYPTLAEMKTRIDEKNAIYQKNVNDANKRYQAIISNADKTYQKEISLINKAYQDALKSNSNIQ